MVNLSPKLYFITFCLFQRTSFNSRRLCWKIYTLAKRTWISQVTLFTLIPSATKHGPILIRCRMPIFTYLCVIRQMHGNFFSKVGTVGIHFVCFYIILCFDSVVNVISQGQVFNCSKSPTFFVTDIPPQNICNITRVHA